MIYLKHWITSVKIHNIHWGPQTAWPVTELLSKSTKAITANQKGVIIPEDKSTALTLRQRRLLCEWGLVQGNISHSLALWWWPGPKSSPRHNYQLSSMLTNLIICSEAYVCQSVESHTSLLKGTKTWHGYMLLFCSTAHQKTIWHVTSHIMLDSVLDESWENEMFNVMH